MNNKVIDNIAESIFGFIGCPEFKYRIDEAYDSEDDVIFLNPKFNSTEDYYINMLELIGYSMANSIRCSDDVEESVAKAFALKVLKKCGYCTLLTAIDEAIIENNLSHHETLTLNKMLMFYYRGCRKGLDNPWIYERS